jgi:hypothetical protein
MKPARQQQKGEALQDKALQDHTNWFGKGWSVEAGMRTPKEQARTSSR